MVVFPGPGNIISILFVYLNSRDRALTRSDPGSQRCRPLLGHCKDINSSITNVWLTLIYSRDIQCAREVLRQLGLDR